MSGQWSERGHCGPGVSNQKKFTILHPGGRSRNGMLHHLQSMSSNILLACLPHDGFLARCYRVYLHNNGMTSQGVEKFIHGQLTQSVAYLRGMT
ncbi:hypothetical protein EAF04_000846 [Stromatinia cepivora]|nr:hypothetical protein EAF04_000846 [Stromatinia cepivora]